jgi:hypothetical protein
MRINTLLSLISICLFLSACQKDSTPTMSLATLTITPVTSFTDIDAQTGGNITDDGGSSITERGVVWDVSPSPTIALSTKTNDGTGTGTYLSNITGLTAGTTYYVRAYATNSSGTSYSSEVSFVPHTSRNKYDGIYTITGVMNDLMDPAATGGYPQIWSLITTGPNTVFVHDSLHFGGRYIIGGSGSPGYFGEFALNLTFDTSTDLIIQLENYYGCPSPTRLRCAILDPTGANAFHNADRSIDIKYYMTQNGTTRTYFSEHWAYLGPRP